MTEYYEFEHNEFLEDVNQKVGYTEEVATEKELKGCPFCGCEVQVYKWGATYEVEIRCNNDDCGCACASGIVVKKFSETAKHAYKRAYDIAKAKWNRRADNSAEVRRGKWIRTYSDEPLDGRYYCSCCNNGIDIATGKETPIDHGLFYCANCGAKMDLGDDEE